MFNASMLTVRSWLELEGKEDEAFKALFCGGEIQL